MEHGVDATDAGTVLPIPSTVNNEMPGWLSPESVPKTSSVKNHDRSAIGVVARRLSAGDATLTAASIEANPVFLAHHHGTALTSPQWQACTGFAIELRSAALPPAAVLVQQFESLQLLLSLPSELDWSAQLRVVAKPIAMRGATIDSKAAADLRVSLWMTCRGSSRRTAVSRLRDASGAVRGIANFLSSSMHVQALVGGDQLRREARSLRACDVVELVRRPISVNDKQGGFDLPSVSQLSPGYGDWLLSQMLEAATSLRQSVAWIVTLQPAGELDRARSFLEARLAEAGTQFQASAHQSEGEGLAHSTLRRNPHAPAQSSLHISRIYVDNAGECRLSYVRTEVLCRDQSLQRL